MTSASDADLQLSPGSTPYYLVRFAPAHAREDMERLFVWFQELEGLRYLSDTSVALAKLQWWREELERSRSGAARHPVAAALADSASSRMDLGRMDDIAAAYARHLSSAYYTKPEEVTAHHSDTMGELAGLLAEVAGDTHPDRDLACAVGCYFGAVDMLRRLGGEVSALTPLIARETLERHGMREFAAVAPSDDFVEELCQQASALRPTARHQPPVPLGGMLAVADALLAEVRRGGTLVYDAAIDLTPLRKLWLVWRNR